MDKETMDKAALFGQILSVDLTHGQCRYLPFPEPAFDCLGGRGFNVWYLYHYLAPGIDPLSRENILLFSGGLLTGSSAPTAARLHINALSPLTGILGSSNIGGYAGAWLRSNNLSSIIVTGKSETPVYLYINSQDAQIRDARNLWGKDTFEAQDEIKKIYPDDRVRILTIGPGGETLARFAAIITEKDHAAGRTGMGAVMGSKLLKAIVISRGSHKHLPADTLTQKQAVKTYAANIKASSEFNFFSKHGGSGYIEWVNDFGIMGVKNYGQIGMDNVGSMDGKQLENKVIRSSGCFKCPVQCKADLVLDPATPERVSTRPEFEPIINLGAKCGLTDLKAIIRLDNLCTRLGLDSTSAASVIAFVMDLQEKGLLPEKWIQVSDQEKLDLSWGNAGTMEKLLYQMAENKGFGRLLRQGIRQAALVLGPEAQKYAVHVKGLELTAYHPKAIMGTALGYAVSSRGGDYNNVYASLEYSWTREQAQKEFGTHEAVDIKSVKAKGYVIKKAVVTNILVDCLGLCKVPVLSLLRSFNLENEVKLINELTGLGVSPETLFRSGEKIAALEKRFNIRHSQEDIQDQLPDMFFADNDPAGNTGPHKDHDQGLTRQNFKAMLTEFYLAMGWDENGIPPEPESLTPEKQETQKIINQEESKH